MSPQPPESCSTIEWAQTVRLVLFRLFAHRSLTTASESRSALETAQQVDLLQTGQVCSISNESANDSTDESRNLNANYLLSCGVLISYFVASATGGLVDRPTGPARLC